MKRENFMLTPHFSYEEMTRSEWAERHGIDNTPDELQLLALFNLCQKLRCPEVNEGIGGVGASKHLTGEAMDIHLPSIEVGREYFEFIRRNIDFDQLLFEYNRYGARWIHCSVLLDATKNRHQAILNFRA